MASQTDSDLLQVILNVIPILEYSVDILDKSALNSAELFVHMLETGTAENPVVYYATLGFLCGECDGILEKSNGAVNYYAEYSKENDISVSKIAKQAVNEAIRNFAEDVYITSGRQVIVFDSKQAENIMQEIEKMVLDSTLSFLNRTCNRISENNQAHYHVIESWASLYAYHHMLGFVEHLLGQDDSKNDVNRRSQYLNFEINEVSALLSSGTSDNISDKLHQAHQHMIITWDNNENMRVVGTSDAYWTICGVAYVEGLSNGIKISETYENALESFVVFIEEKNF